MDRRGEGGQRSEGQTGEWIRRRAKRARVGKGAEETAEESAREECEKTAE